MIPKIKDSRERLFLASWNSLNISGKIKSVKIVDSYLVDSKLSGEEILESAKILTNPITEKFSVNEILNHAGKFDYVVEIGYLPGVTDNVANTARETIVDLLHFKNEEKNVNIKVYTSKVFIISGKLPPSDVRKIASSLYNPLIERAYVASFRELVKIKGLPLKAPKVVLAKRTPVLSVSLSVSDEELKKIGRDGILDEDGTRRGPLALDIHSMKAIQKYFKKLGRDPKDIELESLAQTWSEHCKHTIFANQIDRIKNGLYKTYIKGATNLIRKQKGNKDFCISVFSDNSGGIVFDDNFLITHKVETHNSPSALDPFGGAITGIVGVNRDTIGFGLGAKPVANTYGFCFGNPCPPLLHSGVGRQAENTPSLYRDQEKRQKMFSPMRIMEGVIKGVNVGGNCSGIPTVSGFVRYDDRFRGKPLVFVGTVGIIPRKINGKFSHQKRAQAGDYIVVVGGRVGADGIHGATFSSVTMDSNSPATAVQIGDPITQKKLSDAIVKEARDMDLYNSITDNGAGGISCSIAEMAKECNGALVFLEKVPLKYKGLSPWQIWISESQERMTLSVPKGKWERFNKLMKNRGVEATVVGKFADSGKCVVKFNGKTIMDIDLDFLHNGLPKRKLTSKNVIKNYPEPSSKLISTSEAFEKLLKNKNIGGYSFISKQYDHEVQASSVLKPLSGRGLINTEAQVFCPVLESYRGVVLSTGVYPSYGDISAYHMSACAIDTAIRNAVCAGGSFSNLAILDNFCWCSSYDEKRLFELVEAVKACYCYSIGYDTPLISGKDSMFNDFKGYDEKGKPVAISIPPTLLISAIGVVEDIRKVVSPEFKNAGDAIYLLGETYDELGASEYYKFLAEKEGNNSIGNNVPKVDLKKNLKIYSALEKVIEKELINSSISVASGGTLIALAKASIGGMIGCRVSLKDIPGVFSSKESVLFSESQGRIIVSVSPKNISSFEKIIGRISFKKIGSVYKDNKFIVKDAKDKKIIEKKVEGLAKIYHSFSDNMEQYGT
ncbi:MAG: Phosphoribosylformylglycinamidine synthase 2 [Parcubacteria group bacterium GW2011_GWF2_38_8]|nr:MAG: Phosphoribosylformylglycinamidine synthase 2 [Parcubacteria group bacterium GW2011_GWF2_38_8]